MKDTYVESENWYFMNGSMISVKYPKQVDRVSLFDSLRNSNQIDKADSSKYALRYNWI